MCSSDLFKGDNVPCRFGGEEFIAMLPGCDAEQAAERAEELRARIEGLSIHYAKGQLPRVTISAGVATYPEAGATFDQLLSVADAALYRAKDNGRNRVEIGGAPASRDSATDAAVASLKEVLAEGRKEEPAPVAAPRDMVEWNSG